MNPATQRALLELGELFRERLRIIGDRELRETNPDLQLKQLEAVSIDIQATQKRLPGDIDPHFAHYLSGCSYQKALAWIEATVPAAGAS